MYIIVECPEHIIRGEQVGVRVTVFNYWFGDEFIEVSVLSKFSGIWRKCVFIFFLKDLIIQTLIDIFVHDRCLLPWRAPLTMTRFSSEMKASYNPTPPDDTMEITRQLYL